MIDEISYFNPLKSYTTTDHIAVLDNMLGYVDSGICFVGDEAGYFFSPFRRKFDTCIYLTNPLYINYFNILSTDIYKFKKALSQYAESFDHDLIDYYESRVYVENHPYVSAYYTMALSNLSTGISDRFCNYDLNNKKNFLNAIENLTSFCIDKDKIHTGIMPDDKFVVSFEKDINVEGLLITTKDRDYPLVDEVGNLKYYFTRKK